MAPTILKLWAGRSGARRVFAGKKSAFTLVELLTVIGIISILMLIAMPQFQKVLLQSKLARAEADLRVLAHALEHYRTDHPEYPKSIFAAAGGTSIQLGIFATLHVLTTPMAYLTELPLDPFLKAGYQYFSANINNPVESAFQKQYGDWVVLSVGPDQDLNLSAATGTLTPYAPTNGLRSAGDLVRSQHQVRPIPKGE